MKTTRLALVLGLVLAVAPGATAAQSEVANDSDSIDMSLVERLCSASATEETEVRACIDAVVTALADLSAGEVPGSEVPDGAIPDDGLPDEELSGEELPADANPDEALPGEEPSLLQRAQDIAADTQALVDDAIGELREVDLQAAIDDIVQDARELGVEWNRELQRSIDEALAAIEALELPNAEAIQRDLEAAVAEALVAAENVDIQQVIDQAFAEIEAGIDDVELQATIDGTVLALQGAVEEARAVVAEAQSWAQENIDMVCRGGSISLGTTVGVTVFALTGVEWLGLQAFWATERFTNGICGDIVR